MNKKVLGIDVGAKFVVGFFLDEPPTPPFPAWYRKHSKGRIHKLMFSSKKNQNHPSGVKLNEAIELIQELAPDIIVMEPTGVWYSRIWATIAEQLSIEVKWVGHQDLHHNRGSYGFRDKDDRTDAFCLAATYYDPNFAAERWIAWKSDLAGEIHRTLLEIKGLETTSTPIIQQIRQRLKYEFPEVADRKVGNNRCNDGYTAWIGWLAGVRSYTSIKNEYDRSISRQLNIEISQYTRRRAKDLVEHQIHEFELRQQLETLFTHPDLEKYIKVLDRIGFGTILKAAILSNIYPFDKFLLNGQRNIDRWEDDRGDHKSDRTRAALQLSLGMGKRLIESGGTSHMEYAGSGLCRKLLYTWTVGQVLCQHDSSSWIITELDRKANLPAQPNNKQARPKLVSEMYLEWRHTKGGNQAKHEACIKMSMSLAYRITRILYDQLVAEFL